MASAALPTRLRDNAPRPARRKLVLTVLLTGLVVLMAAMTVGVLHSIDLVRTRGERAAVAALADPGTPGLTVGQPVRTSYGALTVHETVVNNGLSSEDLGGMSHGVSNLVEQGHAEVNVLVTLNNTSHRAVLAQSSQFRLLTGRNGKVTGSAEITGTTLQAGMLPGRSSTDARVTAVTSTDGSQLWLEYADPGRAGRVRVALGTTDKIAISPDHVH